MTTMRLTMAQALLKFLANQYIEVDGHQQPFVHGVLGIFGHGNVTGLGEALEYGDSGLPFIKGFNEQGMVHTATAFAKQHRRQKIMVCTSSIGPGATNMITGAATATTNRLPVLLLPGDIFACRQPDPVLQQLEDPSNYTQSVNDCFKPVSRYWDRISRPEQLMSAMFNAMRVLTDPVDTGAVTLSCPQDVQAEAYDYPQSFFEKRVHHMDRPSLSQRAINEVVGVLREARRPLIIAGGGVQYSNANQALAEFSEKFAIPVAETQAGKGSLLSNHPMAVGGLGVTGTEAANRLAKEADCILAIGTRLSDFTTASKLGFAFDTPIFQLNISRFDGYKMNATPLIADAQSGLVAIHQALLESWQQTNTAYQQEVEDLKANWQQEVQRLWRQPAEHMLTQTAVLGCINQQIDSRGVIVCAAGSLPGDLHRLWQVQDHQGYHLEYAYSCMGYEIAGALGVKMADPSREVYALVGDGSFLMMHSELLTAIQENLKINIIVFNNHGFQCIHQLQCSQGSQGFGNQFRFRDTTSNRLHGDALPINFAAMGEAMGLQATQVKDLDALTLALKALQSQRSSSLIEVEVAPDSMSHGYETWWRVGVAEVSRQSEVNTSFEKMHSIIKQASPF